MSKVRIFIVPLIRTTIIFISVILMVYNWMATLVELPPIIKDWRWGLGVGLLLFIGGIGWVIYDIFANYVWWPKPDIRLTPKIISESLPYHYAEIFCLIVENKEEIELTNCFATINVTNLYGGDLDPIPRIENERLEWTDKILADDRCEASIPPHSSNMSFRVADTINQFGFSICKNNINRSDLTGINLLNIRVDGKINGHSIRTIIFNGYLYFKNLIRHGGFVSYRIFEDGNWTKDKRIPENRDNNGKPI